GFGDGVTGEHDADLCAVIGDDTYARYVDFIVPAILTFRADTRISQKPIDKAGRAQAPAD
ncbi:MAG: hypothetical protein NTW01_15320, partial [Gammaproteobacteria bacterium]|nr:hypothetical protein [Gammaproteobacteria bacterium]